MLKGSEESFPRVEKGTRNWSLCQNATIQSRCGQEEDYEKIIAWRVPNEDIKSLKQYNCFSVGDHEAAIVFKHNIAVDIKKLKGYYRLLSADRHLSIVWILTERFNLEFGISKARNFLTSDGKQCGFHGILFLRVADIKLFAERVIYNKTKYTTYDLRDFLLPHISDFFRSFISQYTLDQLKKLESSEILSKMEENLASLISDYGIEIEDVRIEGFAPDNNDETGGKNG